MPGRLADVRIHAAHPDVRRVNGLAAHDATDVLAYAAHLLDAGQRLSVFFRVLNEVREYEHLLKRVVVQVVADVAQFAEQQPVARGAKADGALDRPG